jgi:acyl-CoA thioesterase-1
VLILLLMLGSCSDESLLAPLPGNAVILAFGDSLTAGNGVSAGQSYPEQLSGLLNRTVINAGISGEESGQGRERLAALLDQHRPQILLLCHGGNDLLRKRPLSQLEDNLRTMIAMARERGIEVILLGVPAPGIFLSAHELYGEVATSTSTLFIEDVIADVLQYPGLKSDAVHPNGQGYAQIATEIRDALEGWGAIE